jgi:ubiquinone/menaquinone biosynthesis C-methylase UbiE
MKTPVPFVMNEVPRFKRHKIKSILDLGCGMGRPSVHLAEKGFEVVGIDASKSALRMANTWVHGEKLANVGLVCGAMTHLPFRDDCFDAVVSVSVIIHAVKRNIEKTVAEIHRTLRKNGLLLTNLTSVKDPRYGKGEKIEDNTFKILEAFEDKRFEETHHFFTRKEALEMFSHFIGSKVTLLKEKPYYWKVLAVK